MDRSPNVDALTRVVLQIFLVFNATVAIAALVALVATFAWEPAWVAHYAQRKSGLVGRDVVVALRWWIVVGWAVFPLLHQLIRKLIAMLDTVAAGDPFVPDNAKRLTRIAWLLLGLQVMHLVHGGFAKLLSSDEAPITWKFSWSGWVAVLLVFILARVFEQGTRMRADLEGTV